MVLLNVFVCIKKVTMAMMSEKSICFLIVIILISSFNVKAQESDMTKTTDEKVSLDYSKDSAWASKDADPSKAVDVFYVYPTIYGGQDPMNMDVTDAALQKKVQNLLVSQAGVYSKHANLFVPYYRQMSMAGLDPKSDAYQSPYFQIGARDVICAFEYYLKNLNTDRPFILAGHSQGTMALINLMRKKFNNPKLQKRLVAAYLIGYSVTKNDLKQYPWIKAAQRSDDVGVVVSFNTQSPEATDSPVLLPGAICINPLSWRTDDKLADKSLNIGATFFKGGTTEIAREIKNYTSAQIDSKTGALITTPPEELEIGEFPPGVFHKYDYVFWYRNLQENVAIRIRAAINK